MKSMDILMRCGSVCRDKAHTSGIVPMKSGVEEPGIIRYQNVVSYDVM